MTKTREALSQEARSEAVFFDKCYADAARGQQAQNYIVPDRFIQEVQHPDPRPLKAFEYAYSLLGELSGKRLLDYGAGDGWNSICFAKAGANVWAIDISATGVELIRTKASANGVGEAIIAEVRDCYQTGFQPDMFDAIYGGGVLHHLDIETAGAELGRIIRRDGVAVFCEPIRDTNIMDVLRGIVLRILGRELSDVTENESPMTSERIAALSPYFRVVRCTHFNVLSSVALLVNSPVLKWFLEWADYVLMRIIPGFRRLGRAVVIELRDPIRM